jgi:uncharacterized membrane protein
MRLPHGVRPGSWHGHPAVRTGERLTIGERAADFLKKWFGTWTALGSVALAITIWVALQGTPAHWDLYPYILLNLCLSCLAAVQGIILQISANRGDRISSEVAMHTQGNTDAMLTVNAEILDLQNQQLEVLGRLDAADVREQGHQELLEAILAKVDKAALARIRAARRLA